MCRTGLTEEENIKKAGGQALINFKSRHRSLQKLLQIASASEVLHLCWFFFGFFFFWGLFFFPSCLPPLSSHPPKPSPFSLVSRRTSCCLCWTWVTASWHPGSSLRAPGPVPTETARFTAGPHVQPCCRARGWSAAHSSPLQKHFPQCHPMRLNIAGRASTRLFCLCKFSPHRRWFQAAEESCNNYSKVCCFNNVACSEEETLVSEPKYTESTCWSGSHRDYRDQAMRTLRASMSLQPPLQDVL